jgi:hypothetical protein
MIYVVFGEDVHPETNKKAGFLSQEPLPFPAKWSIVDAYRTFFIDVSDEIADAMMALQRSMAA